MMQQTCAIFKVCQDSSNWTQKSQISKIKGEMVLTDFDLATGYVQRKQNVRKREIDLNTFSHILARGG